MKKFEKEELIRIFEDQIDGIQKLSQVSVPQDTEDILTYSIKINYSVAGADVLHPNFYIDIFVIFDNYSLYSKTNGSVTISKEEGDRLIEQLNSVVGELKKKNILHVH